MVKNTYLLYYLVKNNYLNKNYYKNIFLIHPSIGASGACFWLLLSFLFIQKHIFNVNQGFKDISRSIISRVLKYYFNKFTYICNAKAIFVNNLLSKNNVKILFNFLFNLFISEFSFLSSNRLR